MTIEPYDWRSDSACRDVDPDVFFPVQGGDNSTAKAMCAECPVIADCLDWGLRHERFGVWGGTAELERKAMRSRLGIEMHTPTDWTLNAGYREPRHSLRPSGAEQRKRARLKALRAAS